MAEAQVQATDTIVPNESRKDVVSFEILINDRSINTSFQVLTIAVTNEVNRIPTARLILRDGSAAAQNFQVSEDDTFAPGNKVQIKLGHDQHNESVFQGLIVQQRLRALEGGDSTLTVECRDETFR